MTTEAAIAFLEQRQPMPSDFDISKEECDTFVAILKQFESAPDVRIAPFLIGAVGPETGLGMYEDIRFVLMRLPKEEVIPHLLTALKSTSAEVQARCCWWACDIEAWTLRGEIAALVSLADEDVRFAASTFLEAHDEKA